MIRPKTITPEQHDGVLGQRVASVLIGDLGHEWHSAGENEAGIDAWIELRDTTTGEVNAQFLMCQVKTGESYISRETDDEFTWKADASDLVYWENANGPVIVVVVRLTTGEAWWVAIDEAFADDDARARRVVRFDKQRNRLLPGDADGLWDVVRRDAERRAVVTQTILAGPYATVGLRSRYDDAQRALDEGRWSDAADLWSALAVAARGTRLDPRLVWPAEEQSARAREQNGQRPAAGRIWARLAAARVDDDDPQAGFDLARALHYGVSTDDFDVALTYARAELPEAGIDGLDDLRSVLRMASTARQRQDASAALVDALVFFGSYDEAYRTTTRVLGKRHDTAAKRQLALDQLDCAAALGHDVAEEWDQLLNEWSGWGESVYGVALQRRAIAHIRSGEPAEARERFTQAAELWALVDGGDEQVAESAFSTAAVADLAGQLAPDRMPIGARQAAALARGSLRTAAARSDRLVTDGLSFLADHSRPDALKRLTMAAMLDRRSGNLASYRRSAHLLARAYEDADEWTEALRFWLMVGSETRAADVAPHVPLAKLLDLLRLDVGPPWERAASFAALAKRTDELDVHAVSVVAPAIVAAATPTFRLVGPQPSFRARLALAQISDRLPDELVEQAGLILAEDVRYGAPNDSESSRGLIELQLRGAFDALPILTEAILSGRDLPVTIRSWLGGAPRSIKRALIKAALAGNRVALDEVAAADFPRNNPALRKACEKAIRTVVRTDDDAQGDTIGMSFAGLGDIARHCNARLQGRFVDMLTAIVLNPRYDEVSKTSALITVTVLAPDLAPTPARRALTSLLPIAAGETLESAPGILTDHRNPKRARNSLTRTTPPSGVRSAAIQACGRLVLRAAPTSSAVEAMLRAALAPDPPEVAAFGLRALIPLNRLLPELDLSDWLEHPNSQVRRAAEQLMAARYAGEQ